MAKITRYNGNLLAFAVNSTGTNRTVFGGTAQSDLLDDNLNADYFLGWEIVNVNENPTREDFNALGFTQGKLLAYLHQVGVPEWNTNQEYHIGSFANVSGVLYESQTNTNTGNDPTADDGTNWLPVKDNRVSVATVTPAADTNVTLDRDEYSADIVKLVDGAWTTGHDVIVPDEARIYWVDNSAGSYTATVKTAAGASVPVAAGTRRILVCDATDVLDPLTATNRSEIQNVDASVAGNALTCVFNPDTDVVNLDFHSATLAEGTPVTRVIDSALSLTISSGSTLGTVANVAARLVMLVIDDAGAGVQRLGVINLAGGIQLDETNLVTTTVEGGAGGADSANVIYTDVAVTTPSPYRVVGFIDITEATVGVWATGPTLVQGAGGEALTISAGLSQFIGGNQSLSASGYQKLPGGLIFQWGITNLQGNATTVGSATVIGSPTFPIAFPNACLSVNVNGYAPGSTGNESIENKCDVQAITASNFSVNATRISGSGIISEVYPVIWQALGY